jgi:hypothetical protein
MSQCTGREVDCNAAFLLPGGAAMRVVVERGPVVTATRETLEDDPAPGRAQCALIAADSLPLGHNC